MAAKRANQGTSGKRIAASDYVVIALDAPEAERVTSRWPSNGVPADLKRYASYVSHKIPGNTYRYELVSHCKDKVVDCMPSSPLTKIV